MLNTQNKEYSNDSTSQTNSAVCFLYSVTSMRTHPSSKSQSKKFRCYALGLVEHFIGVLYEVSKLLEYFFWVDRPFFTPLEGFFSGE